MNKLILLFGVVGAGCLVPVDVGHDSGGGGGSGGGGTVQTALSCGGVTCGSGQVCCDNTGKCATAGDGTCPVGTTTTPNTRPCGSNADCGGNEYCMGDDPTRCIGSGHCQAKDNCGICSPPGGPQCITCGCDGVTYDSVQAACAAGVRTSGVGACAVAASGGGVSTIHCGASTQCPADAGCCALTGRCYDLTEAWRCEPQPDGTLLDCASDPECDTGAGGGPGSDFLCQGNGCAGPGKCTAKGTTSSCSGVVQAVCGCDSSTYVNACWAQAAGVRVAASGACDAGP